MSESEERAGQRRLWGVPGWAWAAGLTIGSVIGLMLFDGPIGLAFGVAIGTAFALAFSAGEGSGDSPAAPGDESR